MIEWKNVKTDLPKASGPYVVSIKQQSDSGALLFEYVAYFYAPGKKWIKWDPFSKNQFTILKEEITELVVGWMDNVPPFVG